MKTESSPKGTRSESRRGRSEVTAQERRRAVRNAQQVGALLLAPPPPSLPAAAGTDFERGDVAIVVAAAAAAAPATRSGPLGPAPSATPRPQRATASYLAIKCAYL